MTIHIKPLLENLIIMLFIWVLAYFILAYNFDSITHLFELSYLTAINVTTLLVYAHDKSEAEKEEEEKKDRTPEQTLHALEALGGTPFAILSQMIFDHKSSKGEFFLYTWLILGIQVFSVLSNHIEIGIATLIVLVIFHKIIKKVIGFIFGLLVLGIIIAFATGIFGGIFSAFSETEELKFHNLKYEIKDIQTLLKKENYYHSNIDGVIGKEFKIAIKNFQKEHNLTQDGVVGSRTYKYLTEEMKQQNKLYIEKIIKERDTEKFNENIKKAKVILVGKWETECGGRTGIVRLKKDGNLSSTWEGQNYTGIWHIENDKFSLKYKNRDEGSAKIIKLQQDYYETDEDIYRCNFTRIK